MGEEKVTLHGVFMEVMRLGVLLAGSSGVGKSELALELLNRGHRLIADDVPEFSRSPSGSVEGRCPEVLRDFLEVRGLVSSTFAPCSAIRPSCPVPNLTSSYNCS